MGAKKKGLANRLAKMSDEDRARYLQHKADMEEEARRRKEQLISVFLKNKLKKEEAFSRLNVAKINQNWHQIMRRQKCKVMKEEVQSLKLQMERILELKNRTIQKLLQELDDADDQYSNNFQSHIVHITNMIDFGFKSLQEMRGTYEKDRQEILSEGEKERRQVMKKAIEGATNLKTLIHQQGETSKKELRDNYEYYFMKTDDVIRQNKEEFEMVRREKESRLGDLWREIAEFLRVHVEATDVKRAHLAELQTLDAESAAEIARNEETITRQEREIVFLEKRYEDLQTSQAHRIDELKDDVRKVKGECLRTKIGLKKDLDDDEKRFLFLGETSNSTINYLEELKTKGEKLLQLMQICRKYETQEEKVLRFSAGEDFEKFVDFADGNDDGDDDKPKRIDYEEFVAKSTEAAVRKQNLNQNQPELTEISYTKHVSKPGEKDIHEEMELKVNLNQNLEETSKHSNSENRDDSNKNTITQLSSEEKTSSEEIDSENINLDKAASKCDEFLNCNGNEKSDSSNVPEDTEFGVEVTESSNIPENAELYIEDKDSSNTGNIIESREFGIESVEILDSTNVTGNDEIGIEVAEISSLAIITENREHNAEVTAKSDNTEDYACDVQANEKYHFSKDIKECFIEDEAHIQAAEILASSSHSTKDNECIKATETSSSSNSIEDQERTVENKELFKSTQSVDVTDSRDSSLSTKDKECIKATECSTSSKSIEDKKCTVPNKDISKSTQSFDVTESKDSSLSTKDKECIKATECSTSSKSIDDKECTVENKDISKSTQSFDVTESDRIVEEEEIVCTEDKVYDMDSVGYSEKITEHEEFDLETKLSSVVEEKLTGTSSESTSNPSKTSKESSKRHPTSLFTPSRIKKSLEDSRKSTGSLRDQQLADNCGKIASRTLSAPNFPTSRKLLRSRKFQRLNLDDFRTKKTLPESVDSDDSKSSSGLLKTPNRNKTNVSECSGKSYKRNVAGSYEENFAGGSVKSFKENVGASSGISYKMHVGGSSEKSYIAGTSEMICTQNVVGISGKSCKRNVSERTNKVIECEEKSMNAKSPTGIALKPLQSSYARKGGSTSKKADRQSQNAGNLRILSAPLFVQSLSIEKLPQVAKVVPIKAGRKTKSCASLKVLPDKTSGARTKVSTPSLGSRNVSLHLDALFVSSHKSSPISDSSSADSAHLNSSSNSQQSSNYASSSPSHSSSTSSGSVSPSSSPLPASRNSSPASKSSRKPLKNEASDPSDNGSNSPPSNPIQKLRVIDDCFYSTQKVEGLWCAYNKVLFDCVAIRKEKKRLLEDNEQLKKVLRAILEAAILDRISLQQAKPEDIYVRDIHSGNSVYGKYNIKVD